MFNYNVVDNIISFVIMISDAWAGPSPLANLSQPCVNPEQLSPSARNSAVSYKRQKESNNEDVRSILGFF
jgi:hypothetical protein